MAFPVSPTEGQTYTENNTVWIYSAVTGQWNRSVINPLNETLYVFGSASATGAAGEIQYTDGSRLAASPNLVWDDVNDELEVGGDVVLDDGGTFTTTLQTVTPTQNHTISFPNATGTVGLVAGSSGQLVVNQSGAYAGVANSSVDNATGNVTLGSRFISTVNGAADASPVRISGTWFAGTSANSLPALYVSPTGTSAGTSWSASGTGIGVNAPAAFGGNLLDLQVNGTSRAAVNSAGQLTLADGSKTAPAIKFSGGASAGIFFRSGTLFEIADGTTVLYSLGTTNLALNSGTGLSWSSGAPDVVGSDLTIIRDAANTLAQRRTTNAQTFRVYGTFTDASNFVRAALSSTSTAVTLAAQTAGTGADDIPLNLTAAGTGTVKVNSVAEVVVSSTVAGLPATPVVGMLTRVTDATAPVVGMTVAGGGAAAALCWYNGASWSVIGV
jgi:hypothetical protein